MLDIEFSDPALLEQALTHRSAGGNHNERLEYLGDAILGAVIAEALYRRHEQADEGQLSRMRASLVKKETLASLARSVSLSEYLIMGPGETRSGGTNRDSTLADTFEAIIGGVYLDAGFAAAGDMIARIYAPRLSELTPETESKDPKTELQEYLQARHKSLPNYQVSSTSGKAHAQTFSVECEVEGLDAPTVGVGSSRRRAEQDAARQALGKLSGDD